MLYSGGDLASAKQGRIIHSVCLLAVTLNIAHDTVSLLCCQGHAAGSCTVLCPLGGTPSAFKRSCFPASITEKGSSFPSAVLSIFPLITQGRPLLHLVWDPLNCSSATECNPETLLSCLKKTLLTHPGRGVSHHELLPQSRYQLSLLWS